MALFWRLGTGAALLLIAAPAAAQHYDNSALTERNRVGDQTEAYCERAIRVKREDAEKAHGLLKRARGWRRA